MSEKVKSATEGPHPHARDEHRRSARERIFDAARALFYRRGIRAVGVETIAHEAKTTKMSLYRSFASKDDLVAECLRHHEAAFWQWWDTIVNRYPNDPREQLRAIFAALVEHVADPDARGCPLANAAVELTDKDHPARTVIEEHKAKLRARLVEMCGQMGAPDPALLADALLLLIEGAQASTQSLGPSGPGKNVARAAETLMDAYLQGS